MTDPQSEIQFEKQRLIHEAHSKTQANIWLVRLDSGENAVLRDYSSEKGAVARLVCRWALSREVQVHRLLDGLVGIPGLIGVLDEDRYLMDWIDGVPLSSCKPSDVPEEFFENLREVVSEMHSRRVAHGDLRNKNIMVTSEGRPVVIDFSTAWWGTSFWRVPFFRFLQSIDRRRLAKSKAKYLPDRLTEQERSLIENTPWYHQIGRLYRHGIYPKIKNRQREDRPPHNG